MVKSIQVFHYNHAPSNATIREKVGNKKTLKRKVPTIHEFNLRKLTELQTIIKNIETNQNGSQGRAEFQYIEPVKRGDGNTQNEDFWIYFDFYINKDLKVLIIGGDGNHRNKIRNILAEFFNGDTAHVKPITILRDDLYSLVTKIKVQGPMKDNKYKNMMKKCLYDHPDLDSHKGVKEESAKMHDDESNPICVSETESFKRNFPDCETFEAIMRIFKCNGIMNGALISEATLDIKPTAEFSCGLNPTFEQWIIFITQTCKEYLHLG